VLRSADPSATADQIQTALQITGRAVRRAGIARPRIQLDAAVAALLGASGRPLNDDFADAIALAGASGSALGSNVDATAQTGEPMHAGVGGGSSVWWRWRAPQSGRATLSTFGSDYDSVLAVYTGSGVGRLSEIASNDDSSGLLQSQVEFAAAAGTTYRIAVDGFQGAEGNIVLNYTSTGAGAANDDFGDAIALRGPAGVTTGSNQGATAEPGEPRHAGAGGGKSVWWRWRARRPAATPSSPHLALAPTPCWRSTEAAGSGRCGESRATTMRRAWGCRAWCDSMPWLACSIASRSTAFEVPRATSR